MFSALLLAASVALSPAAIVPPPPPQSELPKCAQHLWIRTFDGWVCHPPFKPGEYHHCPKPGVLTPAFAGGTHCGLAEPQTLRAKPV